MCAGGIAPALVPLRRGIAPESRTAAGYCPGKRSASEYCSGRPAQTCDATEKRL